MNKLSKPSLVSPSMVTINVTNQCNLNCRYCYEDKKTNKSMTLPQLKKICDIVYKRRSKDNFLAISFFGGEPTLCWDIIRKTIDYNNSKGRVIEYNMTSNFTYDFTDDDLEWIANEKISFLVSIDGNKETHDFNRCNSYDRVKANIEKFIKKGIENRIEARMTIMPDRAKYVFSDIKSIYELGLQYVCPVPVTDVEWSDKEIKAFRKQLRKVTKFLIKVYSSKDKYHNFEAKYISDELRNPPLRFIKPDEPLFAKCGIFQGYSMIIDPDNEVYMCHKIPTSKISNKIKDLFYYGTLEDFKNGKVCKKIDLIKEFKGYDPIDHRNKCSTCIANKKCSGTCPVESILKYKAMNAMSRMSCEFNKICVEEGIYFTSKMKNLKYIRSAALQRIIISNKLLDLVVDLLKAKLESPAYIVKLNKINDYVEQNAGLILPSYLDQLSFLFKDMKNKIEDIKNDCNN